MDHQSQSSVEDGFRDKELDEKICGSCGGTIKIKAESCPKCSAIQKSRISKAALLLFTFFLGGIGAHKFYIGKHWQGVFYLIFCWTGIPGLIALVEFIIYLFSSSESLQKKYSASGGGAIIAIVVCCVFGIVFICGIIASVAIPQFVKYRNRAYQETIKSQLQLLLAEENAYFSEHNRYTSDLRELGIDPGVSNVTLEIVSAENDCFEATGKHSQLEGIMSIDCSGQFQQ